MVFEQLFIHSLTTASEPFGQYSFSMKRPSANLSSPRTRTMEAILRFGAASTYHSPDPLIIFFSSVFASILKKAQELMKP
jgi:hypothetical protein